MADTSVNGPGYWIIVSSIDNWRRTAEHGFTVQGMKSRHRRKAERMQPGDKIAYYVTGVKAFAGVATVTSTYYEDHVPIWTSNNKKKADEDYPFRVLIEPNLVLNETDFVPAEGIARRMTYASKWPAANWTLAFQGNVHSIPAEDFQLVHDALAQRAAARV